MDHLDGSGSSKNIILNPEPKAEGEKEQLLINLGESPELDREIHSHSSSSSNSSSEEDFFQLDASELKPATTSEDNASTSLKKPPQVGDDSQLPSEITVQNVGMAVPENLPPEHEVGPLDNLDILGVKQSPPVQMMVRSDVPDPYRIPSSIFARTKSTAPMEWSVASNESLFSIHMGNASFSRDHAILLGRSGELANFPNGLPDFGRELEPQPLTPEEANAEAMKDVLRAAVNEHAEKEKPPTESAPLCASASRRSDGSATSINSFAFPILTEGRSGSMKVEPEKQQQSLGQKPPKGKEETPTPEVAPDAAQTSWCSCFTCSFCR